MSMNGTYSFIRGKTEINNLNTEFIKLTLSIFIN